MTNFIEQGFKEIYFDIEDEVEFDPSWKNGTGYFDGAVKYRLPAGKRVKTTCPDSNRRIILIGTPVGTVVLFERYTPWTDSTFAVVYNVPEALRFIVQPGPINSDQLYRLAQSDNKNIGTHIQRLLDKAIRMSASEADINPEIFKEPVQGSYVEDK